MQAMEQQRIDAPPPPPPPPLVPPPQQPPPPPSHQAEQQQQHQHGQFYAQQHQTSSGSTQGVDWAAKAKAWMSAKAAQGQARAAASSDPVPAPGTMQMQEQQGEPQPNGASFSTYYQHYMTRPLEMQLHSTQTFQSTSTASPTTGVIWSVTTPAMPHPVPQTFHHPLQQPFTRLHGATYRPAFAFGATAVAPVIEPPQQKKAPVPSWMREELKKKVTTGSSDAERTRKSAPQVLDNVPRSPGGSETEGDEEDDPQSAATAVINQEIKRVLTEVLLKVTDGLFNEIAQEIYDEEETKSHGPEKKDSDDLLAPNAASARVVVASRGGKEEEVDGANFLGLASYDSEDDPTISSEKKSSIGMTTQEQDADRRARVHSPMRTTVVADEARTQETSVAMGRGLDRDEANEKRGWIRNGDSRKDVRQYENKLRKRRDERQGRSRSRSVSPKGSSSSRKRTTDMLRSRTPPRRSKRDSSWPSLSNSPCQERRHKHSRSRSPGHKHTKIKN